MSEKITVLIVDDHPIVRQGLRQLLEVQDDLEVVAEAEDGQSAIESIADMLPDVVLMDLAIPDLHGLDVCRLIRKQFDHKPYIIVLTFYDNPEYRASAEALGVVGFIHKSDFGTELLQTIHKVMAHGSLNIEGDVPPESVHEVSQ